MIRWLFENIKNIWDCVWCATPSFLIKRRFLIIISFVNNLLWCDRKPNQAMFYKQYTTKINLIFSIQDVIETFRLWPKWWCRAFEMWFFIFYFIPFLIYCFYSFIAVILFSRHYICAVFVGVVLQNPFP